MSKTQVYVDAVRTILTQNGGTPMRAGVLFQQAKDQGLIPTDVKFAYNYTLKAAKTSSEFDTSKRGWIGLAVQNQPVAGVEVEQDDFVSEVFAATDSSVA